MKRQQDLFTALCLVAGAGLVAFCGCGFSERSFTMRPGDFVPLSQTSKGSPPTARGWLTEAHRELARLLPASAPTALLTEDLRDDLGAPIDTMRHFGLDRRGLRTLAGNWRGLEDSAQVLGPATYVEQAAPRWDGFEDVWIPVADGVELSGRLGLSRDKFGVREADCVVLLPGLFGDNGILRTRDLASALLEAGIHVLALELRGHGQTEAREPDVAFSFGVFETVDLLLVSEWLEGRPYVRHTGLVGFCLGANLGLLSAWYDGRAADDPSISEAMARRLAPVSGRRHFGAGIVAFSPPLNIESLLDQLDTARAVWKDPIVANIQATIRGRMARKGYAEVSHSMRRLVARELSRTSLRYPGAMDDALRFTRLMAPGGGPAADKLSCARVPVLIVHGANDPVCPAQDVAELMATVENPNVAALILPGGGHDGFAHYGRSYYYSLILNFFDPEHGFGSAPASVAMEASGRRSADAAGGGGETRDRSGG